MQIPQLTPFHREAYYLYDLSNLGYRCGEVEKDLNKLTRKKWWQDLKYLFRGKQAKLEREKALRNLKNRVTGWFVHDKQVYQEMHRLQNNLTMGLTESNDLLVSDWTISVE